jgi:hypothetical protein
MSKLLLLSIIIAIIALPARAAGVASPRLGLRKLILWMLYFEAFYAFSLNFLVNRF